MVPAASASSYSSLVAPSSLFFQCNSNCTSDVLAAVVQWLMVHADNDSTTNTTNTTNTGSGSFGTTTAWTTRLVTPPLPSEDDDGNGGSASFSTRKQRRTTTTRSRTAGKTRRRAAPPPLLPAAVTHSSGARYMRCSRRHAEIDLSLLGPEPLFVWHQCYLQCLDLARAARSAQLLLLQASSSSMAAAFPSSPPPPFVLVLTNIDRVPPALGSILHGYRTNVWHFPDLPLQFVFVGPFLPCAALQASVKIIPSTDFASTENNPSAPTVGTGGDPRRPMQALNRVLLSGDTGTGTGTADSRKNNYPFAAVREELYRAQMFCIGLPEIVEDAGGAVLGAAFLRSPRCRADLGDWAARNRSVFHAEKLVHAVHRQPLAVARAPDKI